MVLCVNSIRPRARVCGEEGDIPWRWPAVKKVAANPSAVLGTPLISSKVLTCVDRGELGHSSDLIQNGKKNKADMRL